MAEREELEKQIKLSGILGSFMLALSFVPHLGIGLVFLILGILLISAANHYVDEVFGEFNVFRRTIVGFFISLFSPVLLFGVHISYMVVHDKTTLLILEKLFLALSFLGWAWGIFLLERVFTTLGEILNEKLFNYGAILLFIGYLIGFPGYAADFLMATLPQNVELGFIKDFYQYLEYGKYIGVTLVIIAYVLIGIGYARVNIPAHKLWEE